MEIQDVEGSSIAHTLPELYRAVLERASSLEHIGLRHEALLIRRSAVREYSRAWDERAYTRLTKIRVRAERVLDGLDRGRSLLGPRPATLPTRPSARRSQTA
ncbi:MAG: hypothetical protein ABI573_11835 [Chloroflexota bacterium]